MKCPVKPSGGISTQGPGDSITLLPPGWPPLGRLRWSSGARTQARANMEEKCPLIRVGPTLAVSQAPAVPLPIPLLSCLLSLSTYYMPGKHMVCQWSTWAGILRSDLVLVSWQHLNPACLGGGDIARWRQLHPELHCRAREALRRMPSPLPAKARDECQGGEEGWGGEGGAGGCQTWGLLH